MRTSSSSSKALRVVLGAAILGALSAIVPARASASAPEALACRTKSQSAGTTELTLKWDGTTAKGSLQHAAPSGNVTTQIVRAERYDGMIIADDINEKDLVLHAAVIREVAGKRHMRSGDDTTWLACE